jgi:hypothetical protein
MYGRCGGGWAQERKAKKMAEMQARLDAYMAAQAEAKGE